MADGSADVQGIAAAQLRSIVERILRLKQEQDEIGAGIKDIYLEAKMSGYDKTVLGKVVSTMRARAKDAAKFDEQAEIFDLYMTAIGAPSHTHAREAS